mgnify:CR=1 FL=1
MKYYVLRKDGREIKTDKLLRVAYLVSTGWKVVNKSDAFRRN